MTILPDQLPDIRLLRYFAVTAEELNLHRASQRLFISQPPLSRHIQKLENMLGVQLFIRHTRGLILTDAGQKALEIIRPLLFQYDTAGKQLSKLSLGKKKPRVFGFTLGFEQGLFTALEARLSALFPEGYRIERNSSVKLVRQVQQGKVDAAFIVLPQNTKGLATTRLPYTETHAAAVPSSWPEAHKASISLSGVTTRPLFWFRKEQNPAYYEWAKQCFTHIGYAPVILEEPEEHDVLLARIAAGEGMGLFLSSFAAIQRSGVTFLPLEEARLFSVELGLITLPSQPHLASTLQEAATVTMQNFTPV